MREDRKTYVTANVRAAVSDVGNDQFSLVSVCHKELENPLYHNCTRTAADVPRVAVFAHVRITGSLERVAHIARRREPIVSAHKEKLRDIRFPSRTSSISLAR